MTFAASVILSLSLLCQQKPAKPQPPADGAFAIERQALEDVIAVSKDGKTLALMEAKTSNVLLYDAKTFKELRTLEAVTPWDLTLPTHGGRSILAFSPDSKLLVASRKAPQFKSFPLWDVATGKLLGKLPAFARQNDSIGFSLSGKEILATGIEGDRKPISLLLKCWGSEWEKGPIDPQPLRSFRPAVTVPDIVFDPTGTKMYLYAGEKGYVVADALTGEALDTIEMKERGSRFYSTGYQFALSPSSKLLAVGTGKSGTDVEGQFDPGLLRIWDVETKTVTLDALLPSAARFMAFSPDGKFVAASCTERLDVLEVATGKLLRSIEKSPFLTSFAFDPDSSRLYLTDPKGLRVWRVKKP